MSKEPNLKAVQQAIEDAELVIPAAREKPVVAPKHEPMATTALDPDPGETNAQGEGPGALGCPIA
jgi:hypothetical protein